VEVHGHSPESLTGARARTGLSVGLIGCGGIAQALLAALRGPEAAQIRLVGALARPGRGGVARAALGDVEIVESLDDLLARGPDLIAEVAGQEAVAACGEAVLRCGVDFLPISIGALAEPALYERLKAAAAAGQARILLAAGAIGGIDAIAAMRVGGLRSVRYRSVKPPAAWRGSPAEDAVDLARLTERAVLYRGSAGEAALRFPQNANVAATLALAGVGFDATEVELIADPAAPGNVHEIEAEGAAGSFSIRLQGNPSPQNPKTSALTALSVARALLNAQARIVI
jgi:aspartate dehydrogenase